MPAGFDIREIGRGAAHGATSGFGGLLDLIAKGIGQKAVPSEIMKQELSKHVSPPTKAEGRDVEALLDLGVPGPEDILKKMALAGIFVGRKAKGFPQEIYKDPVLNKLKSEMLKSGAYDTPEGIAESSQEATRRGFPGMHFDAWNLIRSNGGKITNKPKGAWIQERGPDYFGTFQGNEDMIGERWRHEWQHDPTEFSKPYPLDTVLKNEQGEPSQFALDYPTKLQLKRAGIVGNGVFMPDSGRIQLDLGDEYSSPEDLYRVYLKSLLGGPNTEKRPFRQGSRLSNVLIHEAQHAVQAKERWPSGTDTRGKELEDYLRQWGEMQARHSAERHGLDVESIPPYAVPDQDFNKIIWNTLQAQDLDNTLTDNELMDMYDQLHLDTMSKRWNEIPQETYLKEIMKLQGKKYSKALK